MKRKRNWLLIIVVLLAGCKPIIVDPPEPPVLTIRQRQKQFQEDRKTYGCPITKVAPQRLGKVVVGR